MRKYWLRKQPTFLDSWKGLKENARWLGMNAPAYTNLCAMLSVQKTLYSLFFEASCLQKKPNWSWTGCMVVGIRVVCVFADHCKTGPLWRRLPDCHSAGFSSLNKVGVSNSTCVDQELPPHSRNWTLNNRPCSLCSLMKAEIFSNNNVRRYSWSLHFLTFQLITHS